MIELQSPALLVTILPEIGGKIGQIRDRHTGNELLIAPRRPYCTIPTGGDWLQHDTSGMDDCFPNVAQGLYPQQPWSNVHLPDLGEWTHGMWEVVEAETAKVVLQRSGTALPYRATKTVRFLDERSLDFSYSVENCGAAPFRYLWSAHPLIAVSGGFHLELPPGDLTFCTFPSDGEVRPWPLFHGIDLSRHWVPRGANLKIFVTGLTEGWCALHLPAHSLRFTFDLDSVPVLGVWFNNHGFPQISPETSPESSPAAFRCIAMEPCTSPSDLLDDLVPSAYPILRPGESARWSLGLHIARRVSSEAE